MRKLLFIFAMTYSLISQAGGFYRGHFDVGYTAGIGDYELNRYEINTSHGYQFCPYFYLGAGLGFHFMKSYETSGMTIPLDIRESSTEIPVFANIRCNFSKGKISPFVDGKIGAFTTNNGGLYANASFGCRFALKEKMGLNVSIGYESEKLEFESFKNS